MTIKHRTRPALRLPQLAPGQGEATPSGFVHRSVTVPTIAQSPVLQQAERQLERPGAEPHKKRPVRIPEGSLVPVRELRLARTSQRPALASPRATANDNAAPPTRSVWRELFFLGLLAASLYGAYEAGRGAGPQRVIVVPGPLGFYSMVT